MADAAAPMLLQGDDVPFGAVDANRVPRSLSAFPNRRQRRLPNPRGLARPRGQRLPVSSVERRDGHPGFAHGADLPPALLRELDSGATVWGHALQPGKPDGLATLNLLYGLNELRTAPLFVCEHSPTDDVRRGLNALLAPAGRSCADYFVRVPRLSQAAPFLADAERTGFSRPRLLVSNRRHRR